MVQLSCFFGGLWRAWLSLEGESPRSMVNLRNAVQREVAGCAPLMTLTLADFFVWKTWSVSRQAEAPISAARPSPGPGDYSQWKWGQWRGFSGERWQGSQGKKMGGKCGSPWNGMIELKTNLRDLSNLEATKLKVFSTEVSWIACPWAYF